MLTSKLRGGRIAALAFLLVGLPLAMAAAQDKEGNSLNPGTPSAGPPKRQVLSRGSIGDGLLEMFVDSDELPQLPKWNRETQQLPVSCETAMAIADKWVRETGRQDLERGKWNLIAVQLLRFDRINDSDRWYWLISYQWLPTGGGFSGPPKMFSVPVLMNGHIAQSRSVAQELVVTISVEEFDGLPREVLKYFIKREPKGGQVDVTLTVDMYMFMSEELRQRMPRKFHDEWSTPVTP